MLQPDWCINICVTDNKHCVYWVAYPGTVLRRASDLITETRCATACQLEIL